MKIARVFKVSLTDDERDAMKVVADMLNEIAIKMNGTDNYEGFDLGDFNLALDVLETIIGENE